MAAAGSGGLSKLFESAGLAVCPSNSSLRTADWAGDPSGYSKALEWIGLGFRLHGRRTGSLQTATSLATYGRPMAANFR